MTNEDKDYSIGMVRPNAGIKTGINARLNAGQCFLKVCIGHIV